MKAIDKQHIEDDISSMAVIAQWEIQAHNGHGTTCPYNMITLKKHRWIIGSAPETGTNNRNYNTGSYEPAYQNVALRAHREDHWL